jgi:hypothetical protein
VVGKSISAVDKLYQKHREPRTKPSLKEDHAILCSTISQYSKASIIVDALDEYPEQHRDILLRYLSTLRPNTNLMVTSWPYISLQVVGAPPETLEIRAMEDDIRCYIDAQILRSSRLSRRIGNCPDLLEQIEEQIVRRSDGMLVVSG